MKSISRWNTTGRVFANQPDTQQKSNHQQRPLIILYCFSRLASWALELVKIWSDPDQDRIRTGSGPDHDLANAES